MLLDGYGLVYRGYYALPPLTTSRGDLVNGVFGFASIVLRGLQDLQPDYLAVSFPKNKEDMYMARVVAMKAEIPKEVPAFTVNMACASGLKAVDLAYRAVRDGDASVPGGARDVPTAPLPKRTMNETTNSTA